METATGSVQPANKARIDVAELKLGMYVCELDRPWLDTPFLLQGFPLADEDDIRAVQTHCEFVYIDVQRSSGDSLRQLRRPARPSQRVIQHAAQSEPATSSTAASKRPGFWARLRARKKAAPSPAALTRPLLQAKTTIDDTHRIVKTVFDDIRLGNSIDTPQARAVVSKCVDHVVENADAMLLLSSIKNKDNYTAEHSLNVAILSIILAKHLGMNRAKMEEVGLCGLLHDVGKILTPEEVLKKPGRLTPDEYLIMKMHPAQGRDILMNSEGALRASLEVAHGHHERLDGTGYPRGISDDQVGLYTRIVSVTDTFDAITSDRVYDGSRSNIEAFKILQSQGGNHFDSRLVSTMIDAVGIYPPGSVVQLSSGEIAVVVGGNPKHKLKPRVMVLKDAKLKPVSPRYVNLAEAEAPRDQGLRIVRHVRADEVGVDTRLFRNAGFLRELAR